MNGDAVSGLFVFAIVIALGWIVPVYFGVKTAKSKGYSPHWMWFGIQPLAGWIAWIVLACLRRRDQCKNCGSFHGSHYRICPYCLHEVEPPSASLPSHLVTVQAKENENQCEHSTITNCVELAEVSHTRIPMSDSDGTIMKADDKPKERPEADEIDVARVSARMTTNDTATPVLESRVKRLERQLLWSWLATAGVAAFAVSTILTPERQQRLEGKDLPQSAHTQNQGADEITADKIYAKELRIIGPDGQARIAMSVNPDGTCAQNFLDPSGKGRIRMSVNPDGTCAQDFLDPSGKGRIRMGVYPDGTCRQDFLDPSEKQRIHTGVAPDGTCRQVFLDPSEKGRIGMCVTPDGTCSQGFLDPAGKQRICMSVFPDGICRQVFLDPSEKKRIGMAVAPDGSCAQVFQDASEKQRINISVFPDGTCTQDFLDPSGKQKRIRMGVLPDGSCAQVFMDHSDKIAIGMDVAADGTWGQTFHDRFGKRRAQIFLDAEGCVTQRFYDLNQNSQIAIGTDSFGRPILDKR